ncbi:MAG: YggS family pyridoxal phosphate-dependent enzyme [Myxococcota bacterium]
MTSIHARWQTVHAQVREAAKHAGRNPDDVCLIAVSKTHSVEAIVEAFRAGARDFGENRVQELCSKRERMVEHLDPEEAAAIRWHFIGGLQSRKVSQLGRVYRLHSIDRSSLLKELDKCFTPERGPQPALVQINIGGEDSKGGVSPDEAPAFVERAIKRQGVRLTGLMTIPPFRPDREEAQRDFERLVAIRDACRLRLGLPEALPELSMGMSHDFPQAIAAGATMVRVGTAIFGERQYNQ